MTFDELCAIEPRLLLLKKEAEEHGKNKDETFCANVVWCGIKPRLKRLVGYESRHKLVELQTNEAYHVARYAIYDSLPDCRGLCSCLLLR